MTSMYGATNTIARTTSQKKPSGPFEATVPRVSRPTNAQTVKNTMSKRRNDLMSLLFSLSANEVVCSATATVPPRLVDAARGLGEGVAEDRHDLVEFFTIGD